MSHRRKSKKQTKKTIHEKEGKLNTKRVVSKTAKWKKKMSGLAGNFLLQEMGREGPFMMLKASPNSHSQFYLCPVLNREAVWRFNNSPALMFQVL